LSAGDDAPAGKEQAGPGCITGDIRRIFYRSCRNRFPDEPETTRNINWWALIEA